MNQNEGEDRKDERDGKDGRDPSLPTWARAADALALVLLVTGVLVAVFGGVRLRAFSDRL